MVKQIPVDEMNRTISLAMWRGQNQNKEIGLIGVPSYTSYDVPGKPGWIKCRTLRGQNATVVDCKNRDNLPPRLDFPVWIYTDEEGDRCIKQRGSVGFVRGHWHRYSTANVSNPPTLAQLNTNYGTPSTLGPGYVVIIDDNGSDTAIYRCTTTLVSWMIETLSTKAT